MATILENLYPGKVNPSDANYPQGSARNITVPGDGTGTPLDQAWLNDFLGFFQAVLAGASITPSGSPDTAVASQYLDGLKTIIQNPAAVAAKLQAAQEAAIVGSTTEIAGLTPDAAVKMVVCLGQNADFFTREFSIYVKYEVSSVRQTGTPGLDADLGDSVVYDAEGDGWIRKFSDNALNPVSERIKVVPPPAQNQLDLLGLDNAKGSLNRVMNLGKTNNLMHYSEDIAQSNYAYVNTIPGGDEVTWNGIKLEDLTINNFYDSMRTQLSTLNVRLTPGARYLVSYYSLALIPEESEEFFWNRSLVSAGSFGHGARMLTRAVRRQWMLVEAVTATTVDAINDDPTVEMGAASGTDLYWLFGGSFNDPINYKVYVGGFQIEPVEGTPKQGVAVIGDSVTAGSSGEKDLPPSRQWTRYAEAALNVPFFNRAIGGQNTTQMDARWGTDITPLAVNCSHAVIMASVNDFNGSGIGVAQTKSNITSMYNKAIADGMVPIVGTVQSRAPTYSGYEADRVEVNDWIKSTFPRVIDADRVLSDMYESGVLDRAWVAEDYVHPAGYTGTSIASKALGLYVASLNFWDFLKPSAYQARLGAATDYPNANGELFYDSIEEQEMNVAGGGSGVFEDLPESRAMAIRMVGALASNRTVYIYGGKPREWIINNQTTGAFTLTIGITDGSGVPLTGLVSVPQGGVKKIYTDGGELFEL